MDFVEHLKSSVDIVKTIGEYVRLKRAGAGPRYAGLCPFHTEKTPSFSVHSTHQFYKCFGCGAGGDVLKFIMEIERVTFPEALKLLAERNGIPIPKRAEYSDPASQLRGALFAMHEIAAAVFEANLKSPAGAQARAYLAQRAVSAESCAEFGLGLSDSGGQQLTRTLQQKGYTADQLEKSGLVLRRQDGSFFDRFRGRLMFPIHNESGKVIGFGGRALAAGEEPKYLNSPETEVYRKSYVLYNLHRAKEAIRRDDHAILVEGYMDVIGVYSAGIRNVVASCGTALTHTQVDAIGRHSTRVIVNLDGDAAGSGAAERSMPLILQQLQPETFYHLRVLELDGGLDPDEYVKHYGADAYRARTNAAPSFLHWLADRCRSRFDWHEVEGRLDTWKFLLPYIERIPAKLERAAVASDLASHVGVDSRVVLEQFRNLSGSRTAKTNGPKTSSVPGIERLLLNALLASREARAEVLPRLRQLAAPQNFVTRGILETLDAMSDSGGALRYGDIEARLADSDKALLSGIAFADEECKAETAWNQAKQCLQVLEGQERELRRDALRREISAAERDGDMERALRLTDELNRLPRR